jgi:enoyl-CoA hydratase/carnithine racemase
MADLSLRPGVAPDDASKDDVVTYEVTDGIAVVTMNRPRYRNAQNSVMTYALDAAFARAVDDDDVRVIVLAGSGEHFSAGHDIGTPGRDHHVQYDNRAVL